MKAKAKRVQVYQPVKGKEYPKYLYVKQTSNADKKSRTFVQIVKGKKHEAEFRAQAAGMEPNFTNEISLTPFN